jgi:hypothetical protein
MQLKQRTRVELNQGRNTSNQHKPKYSFPSSNHSKKRPILSQLDAGMNYNETFGIPKIATGSVTQNSRIVTMYGITSVPNSGITSTGNANEVVDAKLRRNPTLTTNKNNVTSALGG